MALVFLFIGATWAGIHYYLNLPKPDFIEVTGNVPAATPLQEDAAFNPLFIYFNRSAAPLEKIGKDVTSLIVMKPNIKGKWVWTSDQELKFSPLEDWPIDTKISVNLPKSMFPNHVKLDRYLYEFQSPKFEITDRSEEFYQDPTDPKIKRAVVTLTFSHPVEPRSLEENIKFNLGQGRTSFFDALKNSSFKFKVTYDKFWSKAFIQTDPIAIPSEDTAMAYEIGAGIVSKRGGKTSENFTGSINVPGMYSYFRIDNAAITYTENEKFETEQILNVTTSSDVEGTLLAKSMVVHLLPKDKPAVGAQKVRKNHDWSAVEVGPEILKLATPLSPAVLPTEHDAASLISFKFDAEPGQYLHVRVNKGLKSHWGYELAKDFETVIRVEDFLSEFLS